MGQKVNPHGLRVGVIKDWDSRWYAREDKVGELVVEDYNIRKYLKNKLYAAGVAKIEIERSNGKVKININCSRPGVVIGKAGAEIENLRKDPKGREAQLAAIPADLPQQYKRQPAGHGHISRHPLGSGSGRHPSLESRRLRQYLLGNLCRSCISDLCAGWNSQHSVSHALPF